MQKGRWKEREKERCRWKEKERNEGMEKKEKRDEIKLMTGVIRKEWIDRRWKEGKKGGGKKGRKGRQSRFIIGKKGGWKAAMRKVRIKTEEKTEIVELMASETRTVRNQIKMEEKEETKKKKMEAEKDGRRKGSSHKGEKGGSGC